MADISFETVHSKISKKIVYGAKKEQEDAKYLQHFLQDLKKVAQNYNSPQKQLTLSGIFSQQLLGEVLETIKFKSSLANYNIDRLFSIRSDNKGRDFEIDVARVIDALFTKLGAQNTTYKMFDTGAKMGNPLADVSDDLQKRALGLITESLQAEDNNEAIPNEVVKGYYRSIKPDITTGKVEYQVGANVPELEKIGELLQNATFSLKSYASFHFNLETFQRDIPVLSQEIHLGNTNPYKALYGVMRWLKYGKSDSLKFAYYNINSINKNGSGKGDSLEHIYHMRFIYELTGAGTLDTNLSYVMPVKFLIYNDPTSDKIFVRSTKEILAEALNSSKSVSGGITISKSSFK